MKKLLCILLALGMMAAAISGCSKEPTGTQTQAASNSTTENNGSTAPGKATTGSDNTNDSTGVTGTPADLGDDSMTFGSSLDELNAYAGFFEGDSTDITVDCISGTAGCYTLNGNTLTFTGVKEDTVYAISGTLRGSIVIDIGDDYKFDLELKGLSLVSSTTNPITVLSGDEVSITAKSEYQNYIYDTRAAVDEADETVFSGAIHSAVDLEICGKGELTVISENNNGIHSKDDLQVKNLTLLVACKDNALKGNDSVEITDAATTLIAAAGDGIKTTNSDISEKGNQRGTITISGGRHSVYAACDGLDAAYDVFVEQDTTQLNIYTDKYSNYSSEVTAVDEDQYYIRFTYNNYQYSVKYYNTDDDYCWVNAQYHSKVSGGRSTYYYYSYPKMSAYSKMQFFIYAADMKQGQDTDYLVCSDYLTPNAGYDTFALTAQGNSLSYQWTNYTTSIRDNGWGGMGGPGGFGGMGGGNTDKGEYSTKGIKAGNEIAINAGTINIKSYDDAIHANSDTTLENGKTPSGNVTISGGVLTVYSHDDGLHADGTLDIRAGTVCVTNSYEGLEGTYVKISGGNVSINASDDGINATTTTDTAIAISGGTVYINCTGDGIDSNSRTSYSGIVFTGGKTVVISNSQMNSALDTEQGYKYEGGSVIAIMPSRAMTSEAAHCSNFSSIGTKSSLTLTSGTYLTIKDGSKTVATVKSPLDLSALVVYLGSSSAKISSETSSSAALDDNGVCWNS